MKDTAVVIPTIRPDAYKAFVEAWKHLLDKVEFVTVWDGEPPKVEHDGSFYSLERIMGDFSPAIVNLNGGVRNLGFAYVAQYLPDVQYIITLDDDEVPIGDPISDHVQALKSRVPVSWMSTASEYMRGFPYAIREEAPVKLSHGVWEGVADWDAPAQLVKGNQPVDFPRMPVPKGIFFPCCAMNLAFHRDLLPWIYQAPPWPEQKIGRTDDILAGVTAKRAIDANGWAAVTGYARVDHQRQSNVYKNLVLEAETIQLFEDYWKGDESHPYFKLYREKLELWQDFLRLNCNFPDPQPPSTALG